LSRTVSRWLVAALSIALIAYIVDWPEVGRVAAAARLEILAVAAGLLVLGNLSIAWRWQVLLVPVGIHTTILQSFRSYLKGLFVGYFVPSGVTADLVKAIDMNSANTGGRTRKGMELASSIFIERVFGAITVAMAVVLGLMISPLVGEHADMQHVMLFSSAALVTCCILALFADKFLALVPRSVLLRLPKLHALVTRAKVSFVAYRSDPVRLVWVMLLSVVIQALRIIPVYVISIAIGVGGEFFPYLMAVPVIFLLNMVPVLGSRIGTEQGMFVLFLGLAGVNPESALVIALLSLAIGILVASPGGYWLIKGRQVADANTVTAVTKPRPKEQH
jgi:uncharacterized protein (TIRG00374 family)